MENKIKEATMNDYISILKHYDKIMKDTPDIDKFARWKKGLHPKEEAILEYIKGKEMYLLMNDEDIVGSMAVTMKQGEDYHNISWNIDADDKEVAVIHLLGINPSYQKMGIGGKMVEEAIRLAQENGKKVIRLDALDCNVPAKYLYTQKGFVYCGKKKLYADNTGWTDFCFFEKAVL